MAQTLWRLTKKLQKARSSWDASRSGRRSWISTGFSYGPKPETKTCKVYRWWIRWDWKMIVLRSFFTFRASGLDPTYKRRLLFQLLLMTWLTPYKTNMTMEASPGISRCISYCFNGDFPFSPLRLLSGNVCLVHRSSPTSHPSNKCARLCESGTSPKLPQMSAALLFQKVSINNARIKVAKANTITLQIGWFICFFFKLSFKNFRFKGRNWKKREDAKMTAGNLLKFGQTSRKMFDVI